jgi:hypothetical protein
MDDEQDLKQIEWHYTNAQDHFRGMLEALHESNIDRFLESYEEVGAALDINVDTDKVHDEILGL